MNKILYAYSEENEIPDFGNLDFLKFNRNQLNILNLDYDSLYKSIAEQCCYCDALILDINLLESEIEIFEFATYFRLVKDIFWDIPIYIYCNSGYLGIINIIKNDITNIVKTNRFEVINNDIFENDKLTGKSKLVHNLEVKKNEYLDWSNFAKTIEIKNTESNNHTIANEWAIYRWAHTIGVKGNVIRKIENKVEKTLYFKYLQAIYPVSCITKIEENNLLIDNLQNSKILYIDDEADKGWNDIIWEILKKSKLLDSNFDCLGDELNGLTKNEIIKTSLEKVKVQDSDIVILDFRLHESDFKEDIKEVTGIKILKKIKEFNPGIQVIIFSATNKVWNLQALQNAGADGFIIKEAPENSADKNFSNEIINSFIKEIDKANKRRFLKSFFNSLNLIEDNIKKTESELETDFDYFLKLLNTQVNVIEAATKKIELKEESTLDIVFLNCFNFLEHFKNEYYIKYKDYRYSIGSKELELKNYILNKKSFNVFQNPNPIENLTFVCSLSGIIVDYFQLCNLNDELIKKLGEVTLKRNDFIHGKKNHFNRIELEMIIEIIEKISTKIID